MPWFIWKNESGEFNDFISVLRSWTRHAAYVYLVNRVHNLCSSQFNLRYILQMVLKGVAVLDDSDTVAHREKIEQDLEEKNAQFVAKKLVDRLMKGIRTPER